MKRIAYHISMRLVLSCDKVFRMLRDKRDAAERPPDRLLQLTGTVEIGVAGLRVLELVDLLWVDVAGVHHRDKLQRQIVHYRYERRVVAQKLQIVPDHIWRRSDLSWHILLGWSEMSDQLGCLVRRQDKTADRTVKFKRNG